MSRFGIAATLAGLVILSGCAGVHQRMGEPPVKEPWSAPGSSANATALKDPFTPQPQPGLGAGMARYFPGLSRLSASPEPNLEIPDPAPEITNERPRLGFRGPAPALEVNSERPRLGFRLFRNWSRPEPALIEPDESPDPDWLAHRGAAKAPRAPERVAQVSANAESLPPRLPVAILAEVDPAILPAKGSSTLANRFEGQVPRQRQDDAARRVQARLDDVAEAPAPKSARSDSDTLSDPFEGFDLSESPQDSETSSNQELLATTRDETDRPIDPNPFEGFEIPDLLRSSALVSRQEASSMVRVGDDQPDRVAPGTIQSASQASDPFDGFETLLLPEASGLDSGFEPMVVENAPPRDPNRSTRKAIEEPRERYSHTTLPLSRRYDPRPLPSESEALEEQEVEPAGRPQLPLERPWQGQGPGTSAMLPPVTFPAAYYGEKPSNRSEPQSLEEPRGRQRRFNWPHLFGRRATDDLDLARGSEADHVSEPR